MLVMLFLSWVFVVRHDFSSCVGFLVVDSFPDAVL
nr:MAG TPA: hypothetical protein [Herelleviridae sp.]